MSLIRSSMIAGVTTGLLGIGAMALGDKESYKEPYFWTATVSTAIVGGLAWAILHNEKIEETLELNADYHDNYGDMEYILLEMLTDEQLEEEYGDYMREHQNGPLSREDLPTALDNDYRTDEEAPYLREKYFDEEALDLDAEYVFAKKVSVFADDEDEAHDELGYIHEKEYELIEINDEDSPYEAEYDFKNHAITTVVADDEDEAWDNFAKGDEAWQDWEIVEVREGESSNFLTLAAEFAADRKARRRSRLSWTRGFEPAFTDSDGNWDSSKPTSEIGYVQPHWWLTEYPQSSDFAHYHIDFGGKTGTEGYHIHLWKPEGRPRWNRPWVAQAKSPKSDKWVEFRNSVKGNLTPVLLDWYNTDIAEPEKVEATGFAQYLIQTGAVQGGVQLNRQYQPPIERPQKEGEKGSRRGVTFSTQGKTDIYFVGGDYEPTLLLTKKDGDYEGIVWGVGSLDRVPEEVKPFVQRILFSTGTVKLADLVSQRSINRYNKSMETWVKSYPAWFNSVVKNDITRVHCKMEREQFGSPAVMRWEINDKAFLKWTNSTWSYRDCKWDKLLDSIPFQVLEEREVEGEMKYYWHTPRPSTIRKMYENVNQARLAEETSDEKKGKLIAEEIFYQCVEKYQPQNMKRFKDSMTKNITLDNGMPKSFGNSVRSGEMMCRRFKKNAK